VQTSQSTPNPEALALFKDHPRRVACHQRPGTAHLDDYQVRRYPGWHRHMTLAMAAHTCLTVLRARQMDADKAETDPPRSSTSASPRSDA
jgi:hypothetical protein